MLSLGGFRKEGRKMQLVLIWNIELPVAFLVRCSQSTSMVLLFFFGQVDSHHSMLPLLPYSTMRVGLIKRQQALRQMSPTRTFFVKSQMKNLKNKIVLHIPTAYYKITAHTSCYIITAHRYNCNQSNIVPEGTKQP